MAIGLTSTALETLANEMRIMNEKPTFEMNYSEYAAASGVYAMIAGLESLAQGLKAEEERHRQSQLQRMRDEEEFNRRFNAAMTRQSLY